METTTTGSITLVYKEISKELSDANVAKALLATTFKDFTPELMKQAIYEGLIRGFTFKNFLQKDVFAIKYGGAYNLVTSIDFARKIGMKSGVIGKSAPTFEMDGKEIISCTVTIKRRVGEDIGEFTATVYFAEFTTGKNLWNSKPRTMIAKVAEMHALRMACPEALAKAYTEEEFDKARGEGLDLDHSAVPDNAELTSTGDDLGPVNTPSGASSVQPVMRDDEQEIPEDETARHNMLKAKAMKRWPNAEGIELDAKVKDLTGLTIKPENYKAIIMMLS